MTAQVDICVCTFRRPQVAQTLRSLAQMAVPEGASFRVIVADNDEEPSARALALQTAQETGLTLTYLHAPARNISIARNACLEAAAAPFVAFIDDDETASPQWLSKMLEGMQAGQGDVVLGPVQAIYAPECPRWLRAGDFHSTRPVWVKGQIVTGYVGNCMINRMHFGLQSLRFRLELGQTGGEDTAFFTEAVRRGVRIAYAAQAIVTETVPAERARFSWLVRRKFRAGQTHGALLLEEKIGGFVSRFIQIKIAAAKAFFCLLGSVPFAFNPPRRAFWLLRAAMHAGVVCRLFGKREIALYGQEGTP